MRDGNNCGDGDRHPPPPPLHVYIYIYVCVYLSGIYLLGGVPIAVRGTTVHCATAARATYGCGCPTPGLAQLGLIAVVVSVALTAETLAAAMTQWKMAKRQSVNKRTEWIDIGRELERAFKI